MEAPFLNLQSKRSLVLAGGGVRLAYHAGVLVALEEAGLNFGHVDGTSGGIFGTAMLASGIKPKDAAARWRNLNLSGFMTLMPIRNYRSQHDLPAFGSADGIRKKIFPALGIDIKKINSCNFVQATFNVCNFSKKNIETISQKDINEDYLIAGMSLPIFMPAIMIHGDWYSDAVWIKDANMMGAVNLGAEDIWLVWCIGNTREYLNGSFHQYVHMIEMSANGGLFAEIEWIRNVNSVRAINGLKPVNLHIIKPEYPLPLDPDFLLNKINADTLVNMGYADTREYLANARPFDDQSAAFEATAMKTSENYLHFRQQFKGKSTIEGKQCHVLIQLSFFIRSAHDQIIFQQFSSVAIDGSNLISGYNNTIIAGKNGKLESKFLFIMNSVSYKATIQMQMHSTIDILFGLDNKRALVNIGNIDSGGTDSTFIQPVLNRIKNSIFLHVNAETGWYGRLKLKRKLLLTLFN